MCSWLPAVAAVHLLPRVMHYGFCVQSCECLDPAVGRHQTVSRNTNIFYFRQNRLQNVEIKCQLDATEVFVAVLIASSTCFWHHYAHHQELKSIIQWFSSCWSGVALRVMCPVCRMLNIIQWMLLVVFRAVVFKLLVWCGAEGYVSGLQDAAASCKPDT